MKRRRREVTGLDLNKLYCLADELGDTEPALRFLGKYLDMLPQRVERIKQALADHDTAETTTAVLSPKTSSAMIGAVETEYQCRAIETMITKDHLEAAASALPGLQQSANRCLAARSELTTAARTCLSPGRVFLPILSRA